MMRVSMGPVRAALAVASVCAVLVAAAGSASAAPVAGHYTGTLPDGATWIADVPGNWNGTLLLYSHGYGPLVAADAPDPTTQAALLSMGYAMAGSSYDPHGSWWALGSAVRDQFLTLSTVKKTVLGKNPTEVYAFGTSMGGLVSALEDQNANGRLDGSLTTCGLVAGANQLNQYQLDGEYAISELLAPTQNIQLTNFTVGPPTFSDSAASAAQLQAAATSAQATPQGRARLALAFAFLNVSPWGDATQPGVYDFPAQEKGQYDGYSSGLFGTPLTPIGFIVEGRDQIEAAAGGEGAGTVGVNFAKQLEQSSYYPEVKALYNDAGLSLKRDLQTLTQNASIKPDRAAYRWLAQTSVPNGRLQVPELDLKTISDPLIPVQQENYYAALVRRAGDSPLLRQAFVEAQGHCNFTPAELVAGVQALATRVQTGSWGSLATSGSLNAAANALPADLGGGAFIPFWPEKLTGALSPGASWGGGRSSLNAHPSTTRTTHRRRGRGRRHSLTGHTTHSRPVQPSRRRT
jgi:hypothetical protein